jgi:hypothetical protein
LALAQHTGTHTGRTFPRASRSSSSWALWKAWSRRSLCGRAIGKDRTSASEEEAIERKKSYSAVSVVRPEAAEVDSALEHW